MARQGIGTGSSANDGSGDNLRAAGGKINDNFTELYEYFGDGSTLSNGRWDVVSSGINTLSSVGIGTTNPRFTLEVGAVGASGTSLYVNGDARVTGILTVGSSSVTLNGSTNEIIVGTGITINGNTGIISATEVTIAGERLTGAGVTSLVAGSNITLSGSTGQVTISSSGSGGTGAGGTWANYDTNTGVSTTKKVKIENDLEVTGVTTMSSAIVGAAVTINASGVNAIGIVTVGAALSLTGGVSLEMGTSADEAGSFKMYNDSNSFFVIRPEVATKSVNIRNNGSNAGDIRINSNTAVEIGGGGGGSGDYSIRASETGAGELYQQVGGVSGPSELRLTTDAGGVIITGVCTATSFSGVGGGLTVTGVSTFYNNINVDGGNITFTSQGDKLIFNDAASNPGNGRGCIEIKTSPSSTATIEGGSNQLMIYNDDNSSNSIDLRAASYSIKDNDADYYALFYNGSVKLYHPSSAGNINDQKLETTSDGVVVTGVCTATSFSGGGITTSRTNVSAATGSIGAGATSNLSITAYKSYGLLKVGISSAAWVRLYVDSTSRTSDASRSYLADPAAGSGLIAEVRTETAGISTFLMTPGVIGWNNDVSVGSTVYAAVTNNESSAADITVTLSVVKMED